MTVAGRRFLFFCKLTETANKKKKLKNVDNIKVFEFCAYKNMVFSWFSAGKV
jgi:hypothetical protein